VRGAIILAGGESRRMGKPKALVPFSYSGVPLVRWVTKELLAITDERVVVARTPLARRLSRVFIPNEARVVSDRLKVQTPLAGLQAGAASLRSDYVAVVPCDVPLLRQVLIEALFRRALGRDAAIPRWPDGRIEPLVAVYQREALLAATQASVAGGDWSAHGMIARLRDPRFVDTESLRRYDSTLGSFTNVNTPEELAAAEARLIEEVRGDATQRRTNSKFAPRPRRR